MKMRRLEDEPVGATFDPHTDYLILCALRLQLSPPPHLA